ncbi:hypothetical protein LNV23_14950 [Paucibacter sp. DJ1R-11]|uniref:hypothetical protein n=1 Tax=Paucibacter sp. DJ1R-11 TaxID=2893556 RepID=UPI0021E4DA9F|nr:hypothetical protein [Paucibacter sp. DJ1R-11]MCV2364750.1 hypothetical protein [Paucibacter sp. DJ1R-11]
MDRLVEQLVAWHNSHPLAKRINIYDVHTIGVVALPFMRSGSAAAPAPASNSGPGSARKNARGRPQEPIEPVLTDEISPESLAAWGEESTIAANSNAAELDALADQELWHRSTWPERIKRGLRGMRAPGKRKSRSGPPPGADTWPAFSERFIAGLTPERIARFAQRFGYSEQPGDGSWPQRVVPIDEQMMGQSPAGGAWPFELYVVSAAIDAGRSRSRVLIGQGHPKPEIIGRRCLSPIKVGLAALLPLGVLLMCVALLMLPSRKSLKEAELAAASAASAASAALAQPAPEAAPASAPESPAPAPEPAASAVPVLATEAPSHSPAEAAASAASKDSTPPAAQAEQAASQVKLPTPLDLREAAAATAASIAAAQKAALERKSSAPQPGDPAASEAQPDIRPQLVKPIPRKNARPMLADVGSAEGASGQSGKPETTAPKAEEGKAAEPAPTGPKAAPITAGRISSRDSDRPSLHGAVESSGKRGSSSSSESGTREESAAATPAAPGKTARAAAPGSKPVVALVGPVSANKADALAMLERMKVAMAPSEGRPGAMQAQVFQTPEGWRPAIWPFASREEAQLINATLIARGLRTRAVDF